MTDDFSEKQGGLDVDELVAAMRENVPIDDRRYLLKTHRNTFLGSQACRWMIDAGVASDIEEAELIGNLLIEAGAIHHIFRNQPFANDDLLYRFTEDEDHHGHRTQLDSGEEVSWATLMESMTSSTAGADLQPRLPEQLVLQSCEEFEELPLGPMDEANAELLDQVRPPGWVNPQPRERYNMVVIGGGTGGMVAAERVASLGGTVALVEEHLLGGDCLNVGCVPSKVLLRAGRAAAAIRQASRFGIHVDGDICVDFDAVTKRLRAVRAFIARHDSAERLSKISGVDIFIGTATFSGPDTIDVDGTELEFGRACIATGASPAVPPIAGLEETPYLTNLDLFTLEELPKKLGIVGAGPIGVEMAQAFQRLGSEVTVFNVSDDILSKEDSDAAELVKQALMADGVTFESGAIIENISYQAATEAGRARFTIAVKDRQDFVIDTLLMATGRRPNVSRLGLDAADVKFDPRTGVHVDDHLQTTNPRIFAIGDVATRYQFTHCADFMARLAVRNALLFGRQKFSDLLLPWCTYTDPEIAHVGLYADDLDERGIDYETVTRRLDDEDRTIIEGDTDGFVRIHVDSQATIVGATIVAPNAGDLISEVTVAMRAGMKLDELADVIHPYPTVADVIRGVADDYQSSKQSATIKMLLRQVLAMRR